MRAETVIATHGSTDFDAFAAMLAARLLYPGAVVALAGSLNRNVREFARLHADELGAVDASRLEPDAIRRLIVVETVHASRASTRTPARSRIRPRRGATPRLSPGASATAPASKSSRTTCTCRSTRA